MKTPSKTPVPRSFEWNKLMAKARNPKPEIRKKSEGRSPKEGEFSDSGRISRSSRSCEPADLVADRLGFRNSGFFRISDFGLRISLTPEFH